MRDTKTMSGHTPEKLSIGDHATDLLRCAVTEIVPTPVTGRWYALTQEREHAAEIVRRWNAHADLVAALREAQGSLAAVAGLLATYPRPSNDPHGRTLLDSMEHAKAASQAARAVLAKAGGA